MIDWSSCYHTTQDSIHALSRCIVNHRSEIKEFFPLMDLWWKSAPKTEKPANSIDSPRLLNVPSKVANADCSTPASGDQKQTRSCTTKRIPANRRRRETAWTHWKTITDQCNLTTIRSSARCIQPPCHTLFWSGYMGRSPSSLILWPTQQCELTTSRLFPVYSHFFPDSLVKTIAYF